jgi:hypothetical protein
MRVVRRSVFTNSQKLYLKYKHILRYTGLLKSMLEQNHWLVKFSKVRFSGTLYLKMYNGFVHRERNICYDRSSSLKLFLMLSRLLGKRPPHPTQTHNALTPPRPVVH